MALGKKPIFFFFFLVFMISGFSFPKLEEMTPEEKIGQLLMVHFQGKEANDHAKILIQKGLVGGIIYYSWANGLDSFSQVKNLSRDLQKLAKETPKKIPLLIAVDQEGGIVSRLQKGFTLFPGNLAQAMTHDPLLVEKTAFLMGKELRAAGITMNLSPVVDINSNPKNPVIGVRSFGSSPEVVSHFAKHALLGYQKAKILTTLKHFPGHGDVFCDPHLEMPHVNKSLEELQKMELLPFKQLLDQTDAVMTSHILMPALDFENCATLSKKILTDLLKKEMHFQKVVISDSLIMKGLLKNVKNIDQAAISALNAGCDILLLGGKHLNEPQKEYELTPSDILRIRSSLLQAIKDRVVSEKRVNEAVSKILALKSRYIGSSEDSFDLPSNEAVAKEIANKAIKFEKKNFGISLSKMKKMALFAYEPLKEFIEKSSFLQNHAVTTLFYQEPNLNKKENEKALALAEEADLLIFFSYNCWKNISQLEMIQSLNHLKKPMILIVTTDLIDATLFPEADWVITTYDPTKFSIETVLNILDQEFSKL